MRRMGIGTEFESVRDYDENDDVRFVNWMATSRCGRPMTNQFRVDENRDLVCLVDAGRLMVAPVGARRRRSTSRSTRSACSASPPTTRGTGVGATAFAGDGAPPASRRRAAGPRRSSRRCSTCSPSRSRATSRSRSSRSRRGSARSCSSSPTSWTPPPRARSLEALPVLVRRHEVLVGALARRGARRARRRGALGLRRRRPGRRGAAAPRRAPRGRAPRHRARRAGRGGRAEPARPGLRGGLRAGEVARAGLSATASAAARASAPHDDGRPERRAERDAEGERCGERQVPRGDDALDGAGARRGRRRRTGSPRTWSGRPPPRRRRASDAPGR